MLFTLISSYAFPISSYAALPAITSTIRPAPVESAHTIQGANTPASLAAEPQFRDNFSITSANTHQSDPNLPVTRDPRLPNEPVGNFKEKNEEFAKKMGYNPAWMDDTRDYEWLYNDNIKYMREERGATWWDPKGVNPYVSYRNLDMDKFLKGLNATEDGVYKGCDPNAIFHWYNLTGVMPVNWALSGDQIAPDCNETYAVWRTKMTENAQGTPYKGNQGEMDFTYGQVGPWGAPEHLWFTFNGKQYHGSGEGGTPVSTDPRSNGNDVYLVLTNTTPYWTPQENAAVYNQPLADQWSKAVRDPRNSTWATWANINNWRYYYELWQQQNGTLKNPQPYTTRLQSSGVTITR